MAKKKTTEPKPKKAAKPKKAEEKKVEVTEEVVLDAVTDTTNNYEAEANNSGAPKNFFIRCPRCRWARISSGLKDDLADLNEINAGCVNCGKWRKFRCPKCGTPSTMQRIKGNG